MENNNQSDQIPTKPTKLSECKSHKEVREYIYESYANTDLDADDFLYYLHESVKAVIVDHYNS